jgi:hypothetical protein
VIAHTAHSGEHDRVFNFEKFSQSCLHEHHGRRPARSASCDASVLV